MNTEIKKIAIVAANDRYNYGDVLLPIIIGKYVGRYIKNCEVSYYATSNADLSEIGGCIVSPFYCMESDVDVIIFAGGEIFGANYIGTYISLLTNKADIFLFRVMRKLKELFGINIGNKISKCKLGGTTLLPWSYFPKSSNQIVFYNAIGCNGVNRLSQNEKEELKKVVLGSRLFSVRDFESKNNMERLTGTEIKVIPDTAIFMSEMFPVTVLKAKVTEYTKALQIQYKRYYVLQSSKSVGRKIKNEIVSIIKDVYKTSKVKCVLLPIGRAAGHDDEELLREIHSECPKESVYIEKSSIYDIMYIIANARCYLGTSLHGAITAASYGVPHTELWEYVDKLNSFLRTWETTSVVSIDSVPKAMSFILDDDIDKTLNTERINQMKRSVNNYFDDIISCINE